MEIQVIEKMNGRINRVTGTTIKERLRVCAYCRVSTDNEEQLNSYQSQLKYYDEKINSNSEWQFAGIYADEAISGTLDYKRTDFMRMIADCMEGKIDMILTKSISRFARNTLDTLKYVRMLKEKNIAILFEEENLNTLTSAGELMLTVLSAMAQQESENISSHVQLGLKMKKDRGELIGYNGCYGYNYNLETKEIIITYLAIINKSNIETMPKNISFYDINIENENSKIQKVTLSNDNKKIEYKIETIIKRERENIDYINKLVGETEITELTAIIVHTGIKRLRNRIENTNIAFSFLNKEFAISELQQIYEIILDKKLVSANFRKKIEPMIKKTDKVVKESAYRPSSQYTFNEKFIRNWV